jgi:hypothetical protein
VEGKRVEPSQGSEGKTAAVEGAGADDVDADAQDDDEEEEEIQDGKKGGKGSAAAPASVEGGLGAMPGTPRKVAEAGGTGAAAAAAALAAAALGSSTISECVVQDRSEGEMVLSAGAGSCSPIHVQLLSTTPLYITSAHEALLTLQLLVTLVTPGDEAVTNPEAGGGATREEVRGQHQQGGDLLVLLVRAGVLLAQYQWSGKRWFADTAVEDDGNGGQQSVGLQIKVPIPPLPAPGVVQLILIHQPQEQQQQQPMSTPASLSAHAAAAAGVSSSAAVGGVGGGSGEGAVDGIPPQPAAAQAAGPDAAKAIASLPILVLPEAVHEEVQQLLLPAMHQEAVVQWQKEQQQYHQQLLQQGGAEVIRMLWDGPSAMELDRIICQHWYQLADDLGQLINLAPKWLAEKQQQQEQQQQQQQQEAQFHHHHHHHHQQGPLGQEDKSEQQHKQQEQEKEQQALERAVSLSSSVSSSRPSSPGTTAADAPPHSPGEAYVLREVAPCLLDYLAGMRLQQGVLMLLEMIPDEVREAWLQEQQRKMWQQQQQQQMLLLQQQQQQLALELQLRLQQASALPGQEQQEEESDEWEAQGWAQEQQHWGSIWAVQGGSNEHGAQQQQEQEQGEEEESGEQNGGQHLVSEHFSGLASWLQQQELLGQEGHHGHQDQTLLEEEQQRGRCGGRQHQQQQQQQHALTEKQPQQHLPRSWHERGNASEGKIEGGGVPGKDPGTVSQASTSDVSSSNPACFRKTASRSSRKLHSGLSEASVASPAVTSTPLVTWVTPMWGFSDPHLEQQYVLYKYFQTVVNDYLCTFFTLSVMLLLLVRLVKGGDVRSTLSYLLYMSAKLMPCLPLMLGKRDFFIR